MTATEPSTSLAVPVDAPKVLALPSDDPWQDVDDGFVGVAPAEIAPVLPRFMFNANMDGGFVDEMTGEKHGEGAEVRAVWLAWTENRAWWEKEFGKGDKEPSCRSNDMIAPDPSSPQLQAPTCAECPNSKWDGDDKPACRVRVNVLLYLLDEQRITRTAFSGIALKHVARYLGGFKSKLNGRPPMSYVTTIRVVAETTDFGDKLTPNFLLGETIPIDEARPLIKLRGEFLEQWRSLLAEDLRQPEAAEAGDLKSQVQDTTGEPVEYDDGEEPF